MQWHDGQLPEIVDQAEDALIRMNGNDLFQRGTQLVRVVRHESMSIRNFKRPAGSLGIVPVDKAYLVEAMTRSAHFEKFDSRRGKEGAYKPINAPDIVAQTYLARSGHWRLKRLMSTLAAPTLRPDGSLLQKPGYDADTLSLYDPCGASFPVIAEKPSAKDAKAAADKLLEVIDTIPFEDLVDKSVALALMLTALVRRSLPSAPLGGISASTPGSGKTLLADCVSILCSGSPAPAMTYASTDEEAEKVAATVLMGGDPIVLIDNVSRPLRGDWLCSILTAETWAARLLGTNQKVSLPTNVLWLATGNKLVIEGDLRTRTLLCRIDPKVERPDEREFAEDLKDVFTRKRAELVAAGLTLIRAYIVGGERSSIWRQWGRFEQWSRFCREPLMWIGLTDPCESYNLIAADDPERQEHRQVLLHWLRAFKSEAKTGREAITASDIDHDLREALNDIARARDGTLSSKRLGKWLQSRDGRIIEGMKFVRDVEVHGVATWKVVQAGP